MSSEESTDQVQRDHDRVEMVMICGVTFSLMLGAVGVAGFLPEPYITYTAAVFSFSFVGLLGKIVFFDSKPNNHPEDGSKDQVMADATAIFYFSGCQAVIVGFIIREPVWGFAACLVLVVIGTAFAAVFDGGYTPLEESETFRENLRHELRKASESDEYTVPDDPEELLDDQ